MSVLTVLNMKRIVELESERIEMITELSRALSIIASEYPSHDDRYQFAKTTAQKFRIIVDC